jgi:hypothetical protein
MALGKVMSECIIIIVVTRNWLCGIGSMAEILCFVIYP